MLPRYSMYLCYVQYIHTYILQRYIFNLKYAAIYASRICNTNCVAVRGFFSFACSCHKSHVIPGLTHPHTHTHTHKHTHTDIHTHSALTSRLKRMHFRLFTFGFAAIHVSQRLHQIEKRYNFESRLWSQAWGRGRSIGVAGGEGGALLALVAL